MYHTFPEKYIKNEEVTFLKILHGAFIYIYLHVEALGVRGDLNHIQPQRSETKEHHRQLVEHPPRKIFIPPTFIVVLLHIPTLCFVSFLLCNILSQRKLLNNIFVKVDLLKRLSKRPPNFDEIYCIW